MGQDVNFAAKRLSATLNLVLQIVCFSELVLECAVAVSQLRHLHLKFTHPCIYLLVRDASVHQHLVLSAYLIQIDLKLPVSALSRVDASTRILLAVLHELLHGINLSLVAIGFVLQGKGLLFELIVLAAKGFKLALVPV